MCGMGYESHGVEILQKSEQITIVHAECAKCQSAAILTVLSGALGVVTTIGMLTDMSKEDVDRFWNAHEITSDDVLKMHMLLERTNPH